MSRFGLVLAAVVCSLSYGLISPQLEEHMRSATAGQRLMVNIVLKEQFDAEYLNRLVDGMPKPQRRMAVARILQDFSSRKQAGLLKYLRQQEALGSVANVTPLWIINAMYCEATPEVIRAVSQRAEVEYVDYDLQYSPDLLEPEQPNEDGEDEIAWGVAKVRAPEVWALGYTGQGIVCGHIDTGCNYAHPDLADHMWTDPNYPKYGWNFENNNNDPKDDHGHGTHTAGTVASDGTAGTQAGVAPDAQIMVCRVRTVADSVAESQCWQAMQFCVSPPLSPANGADLYTMSLGWQIAWNPKQAAWRTTANNVNAAGVIQVIAAGNERSISPPNSCRCPGNVPPPWRNPQNSGTGALSGVMSIGATDANDAIASFSSRGPVTWGSVAPFNDYVYPPGLTRPDMSAPGVNVKSCARAGGYTTMSGTSMATPHVAGVVCLMLSKNRNLSPAAVDSILEMTAVDLGPAGKDNDFGAGRIDALAAVNYITGSGGPALSLSSIMVIDTPPGGNNNGRVDPGESAMLQMVLRNTGGARCANTAGRLRSSDTRLVVTDSIGTWGDIPPNASDTNYTDRFAVYAERGIVPGTVVLCSLFVTGDSADYENAFPISLTVGLPPTPPGTPIWGPKGASGMPAQAGLEGLAYNTTDNNIYCVHYNTATIYKYSADSLLTPRGTITGPEDSCTDLHYCAYDNTFWLLANASKKVYKITPDGSVLRSFSVNVATYPTGIVEDHTTHTIFVTDRRLSGQLPQYLYMFDSLGNVIGAVDLPLRGNLGPRSLAADPNYPSDPPSLLHVYTWYNTAGTALDSSCMYELERFSGTVIRRFKFANNAWNVRAIEYDPRDASYWVGITEGAGGVNRILKVTGFNLPVGMEEAPLPAARNRNNAVLRVQPNPFYAGTHFEVELVRPGPVTLRIYDNAGCLVRTLAQARHTNDRDIFFWDGADQKGRQVARGIYFCRLTTNDSDIWQKTVFSY